MGTHPWHDGLRGEARFATILETVVLTNGGSGEAASSIP
jgi:hypothetical protein